MINVFFTETGAGIMQLNQEQGRIPADDEILCLAYMLDQGDIQQPADSDYREEYIYNMLMQNSEPEAAEEIREAIQSYTDSLNYLIDQARQGAEIRVWNEMSPASVAGFYHLCSMLVPYGIGFHYIEISRRFHNPNYAPGTTSLATSLYDRLEELMHMELELPSYDVNYYANIWSSLQEENASLRAIVNGQLISVPDNLYDFIILKRLDVPKMECSVIGEILASDQKRLTDAWLTARIEKLIEEGAIEVLEDNPIALDRLLIRCDTN